MQLFVNCLGETRCVQLNASSTLEELIQQAQSEFGIAHDLALYSATGRLADLSEASEGMTLFAGVELVGGGKKRGGKKRKAYATPKKNKHKHKNVKLQALSYYAFNKDQVERVKKLCTQDTCKDKGIFMANHWNRSTAESATWPLRNSTRPRKSPRR